MNKASTTKDTRRKEIKWLVRKEKGVWNLIVSDRGGHTINQITSGKNSVPPKAKRNVTMEEESTSCLNKMSILAFSYPILLRSIEYKKTDEESHDET